MRNERFFKDERLPFAEVRYSQGSSAPFKPHLHRSFSVGSVDQGEVLYRVEDQKANLVPGSLAVMNPETLHACNPAPGQKRSYYMLYLDADWCFKVQQSMWQVKAFARSEKIKLDDASVYNQYCQTMENVMDEMVHLQEKEQLLFDLACRIFSLCCSPQKEAVEPNHDINLLKTLLQQDLAKDLTLEQLAAELGANPYTLLRRFRKVTGITPHAYRMNCRIEKARSYLRQGTEIAETAYLCGFFDQSHFHRHFKAMTTVTPKDYQVNFVQ